MGLSRQSETEHSMRSGMEFSVSGPLDGDGFVTSGEAVYWSARLDGKKIGYLLLQRHPELRSREELPWGVSKVFVEPEYRRQGVSGVLHNRAFEWAKRNGGMLSGMLTSDKNRAYWEKLVQQGFAERLPKGMYKRISSQPLRNKRDYGEGSQDEVAKELLTLARAMLGDNCSRQGV